MRSCLRAAFPGPQILEVNPTLGLAWLVPQLPTDTIPSRSKPKGVFRAKSDFYWAKGARTIVAKALQVPEVEGVDDHEEIAALYGLAVAMSLAGQTPKKYGTECVGREAEGVYHVLTPIHREWRQEVTRIGYSRDE